MLIEGYDPSKIRISNIFFMKAKCKIEKLDMLYSKEHMQISIVIDSFILKDFMTKYRNYLIERKNCYSDRIYADLEKYVNQEKA